MNKSTYLYSINEDAFFSEYAEVEDNSMGAITVWNFLSKKYFRVPFSKLIQDDKEEMVWNLINYEHLPIDEKILLASTFDGAYIKKEDLHYLAIAISTLYERGLVGNYESQLKAIIKMAKNPNSIAFCWDHNPSYQYYWGDIESKRHLSEYEFFDIMKIPSIQYDIKKKG